MKGSKATLRSKAPAAAKSLVDAHLADVRNLLASTDDGGLLTECSKLAGFIAAEKFRAGDPWHDPRHLEAIAALIVRTRGECDESAIRATEEAYLEAGFLVGFEFGRRQGGAR